MLTRATWPGSLQRMVRLLRKLKDPEYVMRLLVIPCLRSDQRPADPKPQTLLRIDLQNGQLLLRVQGSPQEVLTRSTTSGQHPTTAPADAAARLNETRIPTAPESQTQTGRPTNEATVSTDRAPTSESGKQNNWRSLLRITIESASSLGEENLTWASEQPNDPSSATRPTGGDKC